MMKSIPVPSAEVQSLSQIHEAVARAHAVLSGDFGKEIETMKALREELIERQGTIDTVDKARALSIQADAHALEVKADAAKVSGTVAKWLTFKDSGGTTTYVPGFQ